METKVCPQSLQSFHRYLQKVRNGYAKHWNIYWFIYFILYLKRTLKYLLRKQIGQSFWKCWNNFVSNATYWLAQFFQRTYIYVVCKKFTLYFFLTKNVHNKKYTISA